MIGWALLAAATVVVAPAGGADASDSIRFFGGGWGHGVGMSQWGAYGLARKGWPKETHGFQTGHEPAWKHRTKASACGSHCRWMSR